MIRRALPAVLAAASLAVAGCSQSTLSQDDQDFCAQQEEDPIAFLRDQVDEMIDDNHWSSSGEAFAFQSVTLDRSDGFLSAQNIQDQDLAEIRDAVSDRIFDTMVAADVGDTIDAEPLQALQDELNRLEEFCDENG